MVRLANESSRAALAALLLSLLLVLASACGGSSQGSSNNSSSDGGSQQASSAPPATTNSGKTVKAVTPDQILSKKERTGFQKPKGWNAKTDAQAQQIQTGTSAGAVPAVKPFNFGRDPGGPSDKTLSLTIPKLGIDGVKAFDSVSESKLKQGVIHVPATGFPWQQGANTYIAGHRIGYPGTPSDLIFYHLDRLAQGDEVTLTDANGDKYVYRITSTKIVGPDNVQVMNPPQDGSSIISLQTCTLPDYKNRVIVQGKLIQGNTVQS